MQLSKGAQQTNYRSLTSLQLSMRLGVCRQPRVSAWAEASKSTMVIESEIQRQSNPAFAAKRIVTTHTSNKTRNVNTQ
jgi:hypothetical protein